MSSISLTPQIHIPSTPTNRKFLHPHKIPKKSTITRSPSQSLTSYPPTQVAFSDPFVLQLAETIEDSVSPSLPLQTLREVSSQSLLSTPWPSRKDEPFRFTDTSLIKQSQIYPVNKPPESCDLEQLVSVLDDTQLPSLVLGDGFLGKFSTNLSNLPDGVFVGSLLSDSSGEIAKRVSEFLCDFKWGDLFWSVNGLGAPDLGVVYVPAGVKVESPLLLSYVSVESGEVGSKKLPVSNPRVIVVVEEGGEIEIIEEFVNKGGDDKFYWSNPVLDVVVKGGAKVKHSYVQSQSLNSAHIKWTSVQQGASSMYELVEVSTGGKLSRHNLHIQQLGPETKTELSTFHLAVGDQTQDLHSHLILDHPNAYSRQLHKCIVAHSLGQAVFDGNVRVNRYAQQTDAGQLTRTLLLEPRATVNVKPNLQIIADNVKCSHGAAISDLEESQLFYFQARGIDLETARNALVFSFGAEVIERLPSSIRKQVENSVKELLDSRHNESS